MRRWPSARRISRTGTRSWWGNTRLQSSQCCPMIASRLGVGAILCGVMLSCSVQSHKSLGQGYYFYYDGRGSDIFYTEGSPDAGEGASIIPPTVTHYWSNDSLILARTTSAQSTSDAYWMVRKNQPLDYYEVDASGIRKPSNVEGPIASVAFALIISQAGVRPSWSIGFSDSTRH